MRKTTKLVCGVFALGLLPCVGTAQLTYNGFTVLSNEIEGVFTSANGDGYGGSHVSNLFTLTAGGHATFMPNRSGNPAFGIIDGWYSFSVGETPVQLSGVSATFEGKAVFAGATEDDTFNVAAAWEILEFIDADDNGFWTPGEQLFYIAGVPLTGLATLNGPGIFEYDTTGSVGDVEGLLLGADGNYVFRSYEQMAFFYTMNEWEPNLRGTNERDSVYAGYRMEFAASPVPEPGTLCVLGLGALAVLRRRKRAA